MLRTLPLTFPVMITLYDINIPKVKIVHPKDACLATDKRAVDSAKLE